MSHDRGDSLIPNPLDDDETHVLVRGLAEWWGPASCTEAMARAIGFAGRQDFLNRIKELRSRISSGGEIMASDWVRILFAFEIVFSSAVVGSGRNWQVTMGISDIETVIILRSIQRKIMQAVPPEIRGGIRDDAR